MDNSKETEGEIIDVDVEVETPPGQEHEQPEAKDKVPKSSPPIPLILAIIAIVAIAITWVAAYRYWQGMVDDLQNIQNRISSTLQEQQTLDAEIKAARQTLIEQEQLIQQHKNSTDEQQQQIRQEREQIQRQAQTMEQAVADISSKVGRSDNSWQIAEAEYLLRIANHKLALSHDVSTALAALQQADQRLHDSGDLSLLSIREQLAKEITALKSIPQLDVAGIAASLQSLSAQVPNLKLAGAPLTRAKTKDDEPEKSADTTERNLDTLLEDSWRGFRKLMVIRHHNQPVSAMLPPAQQYFLYQNMQLQLESARLALLRGEDILYHSSLETASEWLGKFFDPKDSNTANLEQSIQQLNVHKLDRDMPDISASLNLLLQHQEKQP